MEEAAYNTMLQKAEKKHFKDPANVLYYLTKQLSKYPLTTEATEYYNAQTETVRTDYQNVKTSLSELKQTIIEAARLAGHTIGPKVGAVR